MTRRQLLAMCVGTVEGVSVINPDEKRVARAAAKAGVVRIVVNPIRFRGHVEWLVFPMNEKEEWGVSPEFEYPGVEEMRARGEVGF